MKIGFTLAEILITLCIIGVVMAMTLPSLYGKVHNIITVTKLKKALADVNQAYRLSVSENGILTEQNLTKVTPAAYFEMYWKPYFKLSEICSNGPACGYATNFPFKTKSGSRSATQMTPAANVSYIAYNGYFYLFQPRGGTTGNIARHTIAVDINGRKPPNTACKDVFYFRITEDGGMFLPVGYSLSDSDLYSKDVYGDYCAEKIRRAGWKIPKIYP